MKTKCYVFACMMLPAVWGHAEVHTLQNEYLTVSYDSAASKYSMQSVQNPNLRMNGGRFVETGGVVEQTVATHPDWGKGDALAIQHASGNTDRIILYRNLPFAVMQQTRGNATSSVQIFQHIKNGGFSIDISGKSERAGAAPSGGWPSLRPKRLEVMPSRPWPIRKAGTDWFADG